MAVDVTSASLHVDECANDPHKLISLLMAGTLERISQARQSISSENKEEADILLGKIISIINGLRASLDFNSGGDIAVNLNSLYEYMLERIPNSKDSDQGLVALDEISNLMAQVKDGWDAMPKGQAA
ncbi:flagellar export chaperone FliS [Agaribacterium sp. ZY112]|uniref:flagellar export chaperone FliS n=1 Tax=Agaribacterium sp. ZY112 TaxID=3233574 RepID=UPI003524AA5E